MAADAERTRTELLQGTLDMLILRTLLFGPAHGHEIARHIQNTTDDVLKLEHGSLYPALHRLERNGLLESRWEDASPRRRRVYALTSRGRGALELKRREWSAFAGAVRAVIG